MKKLVNFGEMSQDDVAKYMKKKLVYVGIMLLPSMVERLKAFVSNWCVMTGMNFPRVFCDYVMLGFGEDAFKYVDQIGHDVSLKICNVIVNSKIMCCPVVAIHDMVWNKQKIEGSNKHTHVTLACGDGIKPVYSNEALEDCFDKGNLGAYQHVLIEKEFIQTVGTVYAYMSDGTVVIDV